VEDAAADDGCDANDDVGHYNISIHFRVARFFLVQTYQSGKIIKNDHKSYQTAINYTKWP
jgi:hypothetical protein